MSYSLMWTLVEELVSEIKREVEEAEQLQKKVKMQVDEGATTSCVNDMKICPFEENMTFMETNVVEVALIMKNGCPCGKGCFEGLDPAWIFKHRLYISEMKENEHEIFVMGLISGSLIHERSTLKNPKPKYIYQGKEVCFGSYLYFNNCTPSFFKTITIKNKSCIPLRKRSKDMQTPVMLTIDVISQYVYNYLLINCAEDVDNKKPLQVSLDKIYAHYENYVNHVCPFRSITITNFQMIVNQRFKNIKFFTDDEIGKIIG